MRHLSLFAEMLENVKFDVISICLSKVQVRDADDVDAVEEQRRKVNRKSHGVQYQHEQESAMPASEEEAHKPSQEPFVREGQKVGRNAPCPCGSGKKYKQCHGKLN